MTTNGLLRALERERAKRAGFTLVEVLVAIAVMAILAALAVPSGVTLIQNAEVRGATSELMSLMLKARSEAITRQQTVIICPSADGAACAASLDYASGAIVFVDLDGSGAPSASEILATSSGWSPSLMMEAEGVAAVVFGARGFASSAVAIQVQTPRALIARRLCAERSGRVEIVNGAECPHEA